MLRVKICGITRIEDAIQAAELGADAIGFIFYKKSPRYISPKTASGISRQIPLHVSRVGVFVDPDKSQLAEFIQLVGLNAIQIHGLTNKKKNFRHNSIPVISALQVENNNIIQRINYYREKSDAILLDTGDPVLYGGTGKTFDWKYAAVISKKERIILAGGLHPDNISKAVEIVQPYGVDVSSGVERRPGIKDSGKLIEFFKNIREFRHDWKPAGNQLFPLA